MACIVYIKNKDSGHLFAYRSVSFRDPVTKKPKSKRAYLGRVDPETKILLTGPSKGRNVNELVNEPDEKSISTTVNSQPSETSSAEMSSLQKTVVQLQEEIAALKKQFEENRSFLERIDHLLHQHLASTNG